MRRQPAPASGVRPGRQVEPAGRARPHRHQVEKSDPRLDTLLREVKEREAQGYSYEGADVSFELLARRTLGTVPDYFQVESFRVWSSAATMRSAN